MDGKAALTYRRLIGDARPFVTEAEVALSANGDPAAIGAAVTVERCGHWKHDGPCRWPHNNAVDRGPELITFRTLFMAESSDEEIVRDRIEGALRGSEAWRVVSVRARPVEHHEQGPAQRLLTGPRLTEPR